MVEQLRAAGLGSRMTAVTITAGEKARQQASFGVGECWAVPRRDLLSGVQVLLEKVV